MVRLIPEVSPKLWMALGLFLIGSLHTMLFAIFQLPENFLLGRSSIDLAIICKGILYALAISISLYHQRFARKFGLRNALYLGLVFNLLGTLTLLLNHLVGQDGLFSLILLTTIFFGVSLTSVINSLVTYVILEFPKKVGVGIVALFAFFNFGVMLAPILIDLFRAFQSTELVYPFLATLLACSIWFVHRSFFDPKNLTQVDHPKKGSLLWKELHYRLALFVIAIIAYSLTETTFNLWGYVQIEHLLGSTTADSLIPFFWLFMISGQILLLLPLYFFPAQRIFYLLVCLVMGAAFYFPLQTKIPGLLVGLIAAGAGCSAVFPILLAMMEKEMTSFSRGKRLLHYIEVGISVMIAGYFLGIGTIDLWVTASESHPLLPLSTCFHMAALCMGITGAIGLFLHLTAPKQT